MAILTPSAREYNIVIKKQGGAAFQKLRSLQFIAAKSRPFEVYIFGAGAYAAVFKATLNGSLKAVRCFLSPNKESIFRYNKVCEYLNRIEGDWRVECCLYENEFSYEGSRFPVLTMDWVEGKPINDFVSENLKNNKVLTELQNQIIGISGELEANQIGHGDISCSNVMVVQHSSGFQVKLIDYDGMYVPGLPFYPIENGRSEFQHPRRTDTPQFDCRMDRFSFWIIIAALEALKYDKTLWKHINIGGLNTLENFLFTSNDFINPGHSEVFSRLGKIHKGSVDALLTQVKSNCEGNIEEIPPLIPFESLPEGLVTPSQSLSSDGQYSGSYISTTSDESEGITNDCYFITSEKSPVFVLSSMFQKLGELPIELDYQKFKGRTVFVTNGRDTKRIILTSANKLIRVNFD